MKLNNKGYLIVEIIVASVIAMGLAYFLLELVIDLKNKNEDYYVNTVLETDKALMTREVMNDISNYKIKSVTSNNVDYVEFVFDIEGEEVTKRITISKEDGKYIFRYGKYLKEENKYDMSDIDYYEKVFANKLTISENAVTINNYCYYSTGYNKCKDVDDEAMKDVINGLVTISIIAKTPYSNYNYGLELNINYNVKSMEVILEIPPVIDNMEFNNITETGFEINVDASAYYGIKEYQYYIDDVLVNTSENNMYIAKDLETNKKYNVKVKVIDNRGFSSEISKDIELKEEFIWNKYSIKEEISCNSKILKEEDITSIDKKFSYTYAPYFSNFYELKVVNNECYFVVQDTDINLNNEELKEFTIKDFNTYGYNNILINEENVNKIGNEYLFKTIDNVVINNITDTDVNAKSTTYEIEKIKTNVKDQFLEVVVSTNSSEYPKNGIQGEYWYELIKDGD